MPIYAYRCESCDFGKDVLQKISEPQLTQCPECGKDSFRKQVTDAGFQLRCDARRYVLLRKNDGFQRLLE